MSFNEFHIRSSVRATRRPYRPFPRKVLIVLAIAFLVFVFGLDIASRY